MLRTLLKSVRPPYLFAVFLASLGTVTTNLVHAQQLIPNRLDGYVSAAAVSPDGRYIAAATLRSVQNADGSWENSESVQVLEPATSKIVSNVHLPSAALVKDAPLTSGGSFVGFCDDAKYLVVYDKNGTVYVINSMSYRIEDEINLGLGELHPRNSQAGAIQVTVACAANSSFIGIGAYGGRFGAGLVRVFKLKSGEQVAELNQDSSLGQLGAISLSPDGSKLAILLRNPQWPLKPTKGPNVEIRDTRHLGLLGHFSTGDAARDLIFSGNLEVVTVQGVAEGRFASRRALQVWNVESGKEEKRLSDTHNDVEGPISASANGEAILGYIPQVHGCALCNGLEGKVEVKEQRFAVWNKKTGQQVFRSDAFGPLIPPFKPQCILSGDGAVAMVYWPSNDIVPKVLPTR